MNRSLARKVDHDFSLVFEKIKKAEYFIKNNKERWIVNSSVFAVLTIFSMLLVFGFPQTANAQVVGNIIDVAANFFTPSKETFQQVYSNNLGILNGFGCWGCNVFDAFSGSVFTAGQRVSGNGAAFAGVVVAISCVLSLVYIGSAFVSGDASDLLSRWKSFYRLLISVSIATAFLTTGGGAFSNSWRFVYGPLMSVPLAVAQEVSGKGPGSCAVSANPSPTIAGAESSVKAMRGIVCDVNSITMKGIAFGSALAFTGDGIIAVFVNAIAGLLTVVIFGWVTITFPMRFIDILIRLTVLGVITPVLVVCATFRASRSYVQIGISNILYCGASFAFTSILFNLGLEYFKDVMDSRINLIDTQSSLTSILASSFEIVGMAVIMASLAKTAGGMAQEFSQFRGTSGGAGDAATNMISTVVSAPVKGGAALASGAIQGTVAGRAAAGAAGAAGSAGSVGGGSASGSLGRGVSS